MKDASGTGVSGSWGSDDTIVFASATDAGTALHQVSAAGGERRILSSPNPERQETGRAGPHFLPGGKTVVFNIFHGPSLPNQIAALSLETGEETILVEGGKQAGYLPTGHLVYELTGTGDLVAVAFDLASLQVTGDPVPVLEGVRQNSPGWVDYAISENGTLAYVPGQVDLEHDLVWVDREGRETSVSREKREYASSHISPDGKQAVFSLHQGGSAHSVWIYDFERDSFSRLTFEGTIAGGAVWSPDNQWIAYQANPDGKRNLYRQSADRIGQPERLTTSDNIQMAMSWSPDGRVLAFNEAGRPSWDVGILEMDGDREPQYFIDSPANECCARFSPDGKWLAYVSDEFGRDQVYIRPYPEPDVKFLISGEEGGGEPVWSPDGSELFYRNGNKMMAVKVQTTPRLAADTPEILFEGSYRGLNSIPRGYQYYDISPDGQRFLMVKIDPDATQIHVVLNWFEELKRLVPTN